MSASKDLGKDQAIAEQIGLNLRRARISREWTLEEVAERANLSRRSLINLEQANANPSISTLLRLSTVYGISLADLVGEAESSTHKIRTPQEQQILWRGTAGGFARLADSLPAPNVVELWKWRMEPGESLKSESHSAGTAEILLVEKGKLTLTLGTVEIQLKTGESLSFASDIPHTYANNSSRVLEFTLTVYQPGVKT